MNRATAQTAAEQAEDEGLAPLLMWVKGALDRILRQCFAAPDLEFHWLTEQDEDAALGITHSARKVALRR